MQINRHDLMELLHRIVDHRRLGASYACRCHQHIDLATLPGNVISKRCNHISINDVDCRALRSLALSQGGENLICFGYQRNVLHGIVDRRIVPISVHG